MGVTMGSSDFVFRNSFNRDRLVHIIDENLDRCQGLSLLFRLAGYQTAVSFEIEELLDKALKRAPDAVVMPLILEKMSAVPLLQRLKALRVGIAVIALAERPDVEAVVSAMRAGASDVLSVPFDNDHLLDVVREALRHDVHVNAVQGGRRRVEIRGFSQLTPREREVLQMITDGRSNKETGRELSISPRTVEVHRAKIMGKLGARNTAELMRVVLTQ
jgi:two-component system, LuxR family, response regulator FixJ